MVSVVVKVFEMTITRVVSAINCQGDVHPSYSHGQHVQVGGSRPQMPPLQLGLRHPPGLRPLRALATSTGSTLAKKRSFLRDALGWWVAGCVALNTHAGWH